jgi:putative FmdB family regulatory protein
LPIYEYRCQNGHVFDVKQSMSDDPVTKCEVCGATVERVFHPVAIHFKGSGFYTTDYGRNRGGAASSESGSKDDSKSDSKADSKSDSKVETASSKSESASSDSTSSASSSDD